MSLIAPRAYIKTIAIKLGYKEWKDQAESNPSTQIDKSYKIAYTPFNAIKQNQSVQELNASFEVTLFFKGGKDYTLTEDKALQAADNFISEALKARNRLTFEGITNLYLVDVRIEGIDQTNDNTVKAVLGFRALINLKVEE